MGSNHIPGPRGMSAFASASIEDGTLARCQTPHPGVTGDAAPMQGGVLNRAISGSLTAIRWAMPGPGWADSAVDGLPQADQGGFWSTLAGYSPGPSIENQQYWLDVAEEGFKRGGVLGATRSWLAALAAGANDPFGDIRSDVVAFSTVLRSAMQGYLRQNPGQSLKFDDPQRRTWAELKDFFSRTGAAQFNRAPPSGGLPGGLAAAQNIRKWLTTGLQANRRIAAEELVLHAIADNRGNVTLAMGSLAEILHDDRGLAARIPGLRNDTKDYYRFAGAYVGFQPEGSSVFLGYLGSMANIAGNPIVYAAAGGAQWAYGKIARDQQTVREGEDLAASRAALEPNWNKVKEFNTGFIAALNLRR